MTPTKNLIPYLESKCPKLISILKKYGLHVSEAGFFMDGSSSSTLTIGKNGSYQSLNYRILYKNKSTLTINFNKPSRISLHGTAEKLSSIILDLAKLGTLTINVENV